MTQDKLREMDRFPPTVTGHDDFDNGIELTLLDEGTRENPRYIWIPDDDDEETVFSLYDEEEEAS